MNKSSDRKGAYAWPGAWGGRDKNNKSLTATAAFAVKGHLKARLKRGDGCMA